MFIINLHCTTLNEGLPLHCSINKLKHCSMHILAGLDFINMIICSKKKGTCELSIFFSWIVFLTNKKDSIMKSKILNYTQEKLLVLNVCIIFSLVFQSLLFLGWGQVLKDGKGISQELAMKYYSEKVRILICYKSLNK